MNEPHYLLVGILSVAVAGVGQLCTFECPFLVRWKAMVLISLRLDRSCVNSLRNVNLSCGRAKTTVRAFGTRHQFYNMLIIEVPRVWDSPTWTALLWVEKRKWEWDTGYFGAAPHRTCFQRVLGRQSDKVYLENAEVPRGQEENHGIGGLVLTAFKQADLG